MRRFTKKEKAELSIIVISVLVVAIVGILTSELALNRVEAIKGAAVTLDPNIPTYPGSIVLLKEYCSAELGAGDCDTICGSKTCVPLHETCSVSMDENICWCCSSP
jgi:hypothetical protein